MKAYILFVFLVVTSFTVSSQENEKIYVMINKNTNTELFLFNKNINKAKIKIISYDRKNEGFKENKNNSELIIVEPIPNERFYEFNSVKPPKKISNLKKIKFYNIIDISKHKVWNKQYPNNIYFIEKISVDCFYVWEMTPKIYE